MEVIFTIVGTFVPFALYYNTVKGFRYGLTAVNSIAKLWGHVCCLRMVKTSRKHLRAKVTPDFHLTYSKNGGNLGSESKG